MHIRKKFFSDLLIRHLWTTIFINECPDLCVSHMRRIRSATKDGERKYKKFLADLEVMQFKLRIQLLPKVCWLEENTKVFTEEEKEADLIENSKYNKRQSKTIHAAIDRIQSNI